MFGDSPNTFTGTSAPLPAPEPELAEDTGAHADDDAAAELPELLTLPSELEPRTHGYVTPANLEYLFLHFGLELMEGMPFPWQHRFQKEPPPEIGATITKREPVRLLRIEAAQHHAGLELHGPLHYWQLTEETL